MIFHRFWRFVAIGILVLSTIAVNPSQTLACSCGGNGPYGNVAFVGHVIVVVKGEWVQQRLLINGYRDADTVALLAVDRLWKGTPRPSYAVVGAEGGEPFCMLDFVPGAAYTIHGRETKRGPGPLSTTLCDGSYQMNHFSTS